MHPGIAKAVIAQAVRDWLNLGTSTPAGRDAFRFLFSDLDDRLAVWCRAANLDIQEFRHRLRLRLARAHAA